MDSFLQTGEWLEFQKSIGRKAWRFDNGKFQANIIRHDLPFGKNYLYIPHGPQINLGQIQAGLGHEISDFVRQLKDIGRENKSIFIKMEPLHDVVPEVLFQNHVKLKRSNKEIQPKRTVILDLSKSGDELMGAMHHKTRYNINLAERKGIQIHESGDIKTFWKLLKHTAKADRFSTHEFSYYEKLLNYFDDSKDLKVKLHLAMFEGKAIAGALVGTYADTAYYLHGAMDREYRSLMAPYLLHWDIILKLKTADVKFYDFWGIDAVKWPGVTRFKLGFGGQTVERPGAFDLTLAKFWHLAYKVASRLF